MKDLDVRYHEEAINKASNIISACTSIQEEFDAMKTSLENDANFKLFVTKFSLGNEIGKHSQDIISIGKAYTDAVNQNAERAKSTAIYLKENQENAKSGA